MQYSLFFARRRPLSRSRLFLARTLTGAAASHTIAVRGMGSDPRGSRAVSGSCWSLRSASATVSLARRVCLSPRFYPHLSEPAGPLPDGVPRFGGALPSLRRSRMDQVAERSLPHSDGCALLPCQPVFPFSTPRSFPIVGLRFTFGPSSRSSRRRGSLAVP